MYTESKVQEMRKFLKYEKRNLKDIMIEHEAVVPFEHWLQLYGQKLRKTCIEKVIRDNARQYANSVVNAMFDFEGEL